MTSENLIRAIELIKSGDKDSAVSILENILNEDPNNEKAWAWMYAGVNDIEKKKYCLQKVLKINPSNEKAINALRRLEQIELIDTLNADYETRNESDISAHDKEELSNSVDGTNIQKNRRPILVIGSIVGLILIISIIALIMLRSKGGIGIHFFSTPTPTLVPYNNEMIPVLQELIQWQSDTSDYINTKAEFLEDYQTIQYAFSETLGSNYIKEILKSDQPFINQVIRSSNALSNQGKSILNTMNLITPPAEISATHNVIIKCVQERIGCYDEISLGLSTFTLIGSDHSFVGPECYSFDAAVEKLSEYINNQ